MQYKRKPGSIIISTNAILNEKNKKVSNDTNNRDYVVRTVISYIEEGLSIEDALEKIMKDDIVKEFEYFEKYDIDIKTRFRDWVKREINKPRRKKERIINNDEEER